MIKRNYLVIIECLSGIEMKKIKEKMNKVVYLGLPILQIGKAIMYKFWYDYIKQKYPNNAKLCYMDTDRFIIHMKTEDFYEICYLEKTFDTSHYEVDRPLKEGNNKKVIELMKEELEGKLIT